MKQIMFVRKFLVQVQNISGAAEETLDGR